MCLFLKNQKTRRSCRVEVSSLSYSTPPSLMNCISLKRTGLDVMQSHLLHRMCFGQYHEILGESVKMRNKYVEERRGWLSKGHKPVTWKVACHALANWATESLGNSAATQWLSWVLKAKLPGIQPKQIASWHVQCGGCGKCKVQVAGLVINMIQTRHSGSNLCSWNVYWYPLSCHNSELALNITVMVV